MPRRFLRQLHGISATLLLAIIPLALGAATTATAPADSLAALAAHLAAMKNVKTLQADFTCEKRMAMLETPLVSSGKVWIAKPGSVRFATDKPYVSEIILHDGKVLTKSQHENQWTRTDAGARPGLNAVMGQLAGWSTGEPGALAEMYDVTTATGEIPPRPDSLDEKSAVVNADFFVLKPKNEVLAKSIKRILLAIDRQSHHLLHVEITTAQNDITRYWFHDVQLDAQLPADTFSPAGAK